MEYDYVVVGAGAAGCVIASRLSEDPSVQVLLVEAGGSDRSLIVDMPAALPFAYASKRLGWHYQAGPEPYLNGRSIDEKRGRAIGGSTTINAMIYNRGNPLDYEGWAETGLAEWSYAHCLPYFRRLESFSGGTDPWRGGDGPMHVTRCKADHKLHEIFLRSGEQLGFGVTKDHNGYRQEGLHIAQAYIHNGRRWSAARGYLDPAAGRSNLHICTDALVERVLFDDDNAVGIQYQKHGKRVTAHAGREVILCAGAFNSPKLLMLSGIGDAGELQPHGIDVQVHLPQVGKNLENHPGVNLQYATSRENSLVSELGPIGQAKLGLNWLLWKNGLGTTNFFESGAFLRSSDRFAYPNVQFEFLPLTRLLKNGRLIAIPGFQFWLDLSRPKSRGRVKLQSASPAAAPDIVFNHFAEADDMRDMIDSIRLARRIIAQPAWDAVRGEELAPGAHAQTDKELEAFVRSNTGSSYHPSGTCRMGTDEDAVVDNNGRVRGVSGLRVVDAAIMPRIVTANLSACVLMMAEKISDHIRGRAALPPSSAPWFNSVTERTAA
ncbi:choline dehydrogenase [Burkholderia pyrrocinia]|uniref:choline dehydrogenase n=1 Tax=Burkholderia pyrrocinia TaxID=60550 RepID=UPI001575A8E3|nr:choline dehydrogenase [Burkholderia pyrrocinia]NTX26745.1 choline dehydrogenase [Burkholderia pyrrocinia]